MTIKPYFILLSFVLLSGFSLQPVDERKAQESLPMSQHPIWQALEKTKISEDKKGFFCAQIPAEVRDLAGKEITVNGFMMPLEAKEKFKHFLLAKRTPTCPFCPPGQPNEIVDVWMTGNVKYTEDLVTVKGRFELMNNTEMGLFFRLKNAELTK